jgi:hypothetical protein
LIPVILMSYVHSIVVIPAEAGIYKGTGFLFSQETLDSVSSTE